MPSDSAGNYILPDGYLAVTGQPALASQHNTPLEDIALGLTARLMRNGSAPMTGPLRVADGAVGAPGLVFAGATGWGFYKTANGFAVALDGVKVAEFTPTGLAGGMPIGMGPIPWSFSTPPTGWVLCNGQLLSRTTYSALWTMVSAEITAGNTLFTVGDGSTTFGIPDLRGRVPAGADDMGVAAANRLTAAGAGFSGTQLGAAGGAQGVSLTAAQLAGHTHSGTTGGMKRNNPHKHGIDVRSGVYTRQEGTSAGNVWHDVSAGETATADIDHEHDFTTDSGAGLSGAAHLNVQPTIITNYIIYTGVL